MLARARGEVGEGGLVLTRPLGTHIKWSHTAPLELLSGGGGGAAGGSCCTSFSWAESEGQGDRITILVRWMLAYPVAYHLHLSQLTNSPCTLQPCLPNGTHRMFCVGGRRDTPSPATRNS